MYSVTKHYPHSLGLSVVFRQFKATSHCAQFHGYALAFTAELTASTLDRRGWVYDFGGLKPFKAWLTETFDHRLLLDINDPLSKDINFLNAMDTHQAANIVRVERVGCEAFAKLAHEKITTVIEHDSDAVLRNVRCRRMTVHEHAGNSASYAPKEI